MLTALSPAAKTSAAAPFDTLSKPVEVLVGCSSESLSDQVPSHINVKAVNNSSIVELGEHIYDQDYLDSKNLDFYELYTQFDFSFDEGKTWVAYTPEWDRCAAASNKYYNRHCQDIYYNEEYNTADTETWLLEWMEDDGTWSDPDQGYCSIPGIEKYMVNRKYDSYDVPYFIIMKIQ